MWTDGNKGCVDVNGSEVVQSVLVNGKREGKWRLMPRCERTGNKTLRGCERKGEGKSQSVNVNGKGITRNGCERNGNCQIHWMWRKRKTTIQGCERKEDDFIQVCERKRNKLMRGCERKENHLNHRCERKRHHRSYGCERKGNTQNTWIRTEEKKRKGKGKGTNQIHACWMNEIATNSFINVNR